MRATFFGDQARRHWLRLASVISLGLAVVASVLGANGRWIELLPISAVALLITAWLKPRVYSYLNQRIEKQTRLSASWFAAIGGAALLAGLGSGLATLLVSRLTSSPALPLSIWLMDWLLSLVAFSLVYAYTQSLQPTSRPEGRQWPAFAIFFLAGLALAWKALPYPMAWDDLHLIRSFSAEELVNAFRGNWDPDQIESQGYRPLTVLFNHFRHGLFQDNVILHRILLVALYAAFLTRVVAIATRFGMAEPLAILAGLLSLAARQNMYHYVWLSDGIHVFQGLLLAQSLYLMMRGIDTRQAANFVYAAGFGLAALLVREDNLVLIPLALLLAVAYTRYVNAPKAERWKAFAYCVLLALMAAVYYLVRGEFVDSAQPLGFDFSGLLNAASLSAFGFMGRQSFDAASRLLVGLWPLVLAAYTLLLANLARRQSGSTPLLWLAAAGIACSVGLVNDRANLLLFSTTCFAFSLAALFAQYAPPRAGMALLVLLAMGSAYISQTAAEAFHPSASNVVFWNAEFMYGRHSQVATIPPERYEATAARLACFGIQESNAPESYDGYLDAGNSDPFSQMMREALASSRRRPSVDGHFFVPLLEPLTP